MRIIGGQRRGLRLAEVGAGDPQAHLRPTSDRVREAIFNLLINGGYGNPVAGARVLDLFAGTGALGLEALSRGADHVTFVDTGRAALAILRQNIALMRAGDRTLVMAQDATHLPAQKSAPATLVFADPPYGSGLGERALTSARGSGWIAPDALVVCEEGRETALPEGFDPLDRRSYGDTVISILKALP